MKVLLLSAPMGPKHPEVDFASLKIFSDLFTLPGQCPARVSNLFRTCSPSVRVIHIKQKEF